MDKIFAYDGNILCFCRDGVWTSCSLDNGVVTPDDIVVDFVPPVGRLTLQEVLAQLGPNFTVTVAAVKPKKSKKKDGETLGNDEDEEELPDSFT